MKKIAFYVSCHGLGHAVRIKELLTRILEQDPDAQLYVTGTMPEWVFTEKPSLKVCYRNLKCDIGAVQIDSLNLDVRNTLEQNARFYKGIDAPVKHETDFIRREKIDLIVGDIPPLAFLVAAKAKVKSVAVGNFSWDWIYEPYVKQHPNYRYLLDFISGAYRKADLLLRLPFHGEMSAFRKAIDIPLIARKASTPQQKVRELLGVKEAEKRKVVFISMGGHRIAEIKGGVLEDFGDYIFISFFRPSEKIKNLILLKDRAGIAHPDIVSASDLVISKPGFSTVAECIANTTPLMYTSRDNFREYPIMEEAVKSYCQSYKMPRDDFYAGSWRPHLDSFFEHRGGFRWDRIATDGAARAAKKILEMAS